MKRLNGVLHVTREEKSFPPGWQKHSRGKRRPKIIWRQMLRDGEIVEYSRRLCIWERKKKMQNVKRLTRLLFWPGGVLLKIWLQNIAVLTVNYYVVRSTDKTKHATHISLLLFCIVLAPKNESGSFLTSLHCKIYLLLKCVTRTKCVVMTYSYIWNTT